MATLTKKQRTLIQLIEDMSGVTARDYEQHKAEQHALDIWDCDCGLARETRYNLLRRDNAKRELGIYNW